MIVAALATMPGREAVLARALASLRPQVTEIRVVCHDMTEPPECVRKYADRFVCEPDIFGSAAKLRWARACGGLYLACDDDIEYPPDYAERMLSQVQRFKGRALVTCHGRVLVPQPSGFKDVQFAAQAFGRTRGAYLNYPGACALAFDTRLNVPIEYTRNCEEAGLAIWAQRHRVPIWLVPHTADWLTYLLPRDEKRTIWSEEKASGFARRNAVLAQHSGAWQVNERRAAWPAP